MGQLLGENHNHFFRNEAAVTTENLFYNSILYHIEKPGLLKISDWICPFLLAAGDYFAIILALFAAFYIRLTVLNNLFPYVGSFYIESPILFALPLIYIALISFEGLYSKRMPFWQSAENIFKVCIYASAFILGILYLTDSKDVSRLFIGFSLVLVFFFILGERYLVKRFLVVYGLWRKPVLIFGVPAMTRILTKTFQEDPTMGYRVAGVVEINPTVAGSNLLAGNLFHLEQLIKDNQVQQVIIAAPELEAARIMALIRRVQPLVRELMVVPDLPGMPLSNFGVDILFNQKIVLLKTKNNLARLSNRCFKMIFDYLLVGMGLFALLPVFLLIVLIIKIDSPGPVIFGHKRIGAKEKSFTCYKFRTMVTDAERVLEHYLADNAAARREWEENFKLKDDPRITKIGRWLRQTSLDELPQLFNVLKGEMSLVGPRPIVKGEIPKYQEVINDYYLVRPGITGYWQINGRSNVDYETRVQMDSWYVRNWSIWLDLALICKTFKVVLEKKGAY